MAFRATCPDALRMPPQAPFLLYLRTDVSKVKVSCQIMPSTRIVTTKLHGLDPRSAEFYVVAAGYFREHSRAHRNYGRFFIGLSLLSWAGMFAATSRLFASLQFFCFCFAAFVGWLVLTGAKRTAFAVAQAEADSAIDSRLESLRRAARTLPFDPVSVLILECARTDANAG